MHSAFSLETFIVIIILVCYIFTSHFVEIRKVTYLHQSVVAILMGMITAILAKLIFAQQLQFNNQIFFTFILPPIIFAAGYNLRKSLFFQNFGIISFLGIIGTILSFMLISGFIGFFNKIIFESLLTPSQVLLISSVLCATDTVAALSLVKQEKFPVLNAVLFGEGIVNDAVAIIIFRSVSNFTTQQNEGMTLITVATIFGNFLYLLISSLAVGAVFGLGLSYFLKNHISFNKFPIKQTSLILLTAYSSYLFSELIKLSGIISLFTCSLIMGHYCYLNISQQSQRGTVIAFDTVGYLAEAFLFTYLGICILSIETHWNSIGMAFLILLVLPLARAMAVYILPLFFIICRKQFVLKSKQLKVCWYSGLIRGAIAFALSLQIDTPHSPFIKTCTLIIVLFTTIFGSVFLKTFSKYIGLEQEIEKKQDQIYKDVEQLQSKLPSSKYNEIGASNITKTENLKSFVAEKENDIELGKWERFETQYLKPIFAKVPKPQFKYEVQNQEKPHTSRTVQQQLQQL